jgi:electron transport complex protein RnfB
MQMNNFNKRNRRMHPFVEKCICPVCGYSEIHERGIPCRSLRCPHCNVPLLPGDLIQRPISNKTFENNVYNENEKVHENKKQYPKVDANNCIGCGACINTCPMNAISLGNNVAKIDETICRNCRKCVKVCPVRAIE